MHKTCKWYICFACLITFSSFDSILRGNSPLAWLYATGITTRISLNCSSKFEGSNSIILYFKLLAGANKIKFASIFKFYTVLYRFWVSRYIMKYQIKVYPQKGYKQFLNIVDSSAAWLGHFKWEHSNGKFVVGSKFTGVTLWIPEISVITLTISHCFNSALPLCNKASILPFKLIEYT